jgi:hypothetical protein
MRKILLALVVFAGLISSADAQTLWGIEVGDKNQYNTWEDAGGMRQKTGVDFWGTATYKDGMLEMSLPDGKDADFQTAFIELVMNYGQPSIFNDRNIMLEKENARQDSIDAYIAAQKKINPRYKHKETTVIPEDTRTVDQLVADGDMIMRRNWILVDYEMELVYDQYGLRYRLKYL